MKTRTKTLAVVEIAIVLCLLFFVITIPAIAAEQNTQKVGASTTASEDHYVLGIYGNANEDNTIDMRDLTYVKLIFFGKKPETELADAKYDGKINPLDFIQIKLIIVGKEKELTVVDSADRTVTVSMPVNRIVPMVTWVYEPMWIIEAQDKIVGVTTCARDLNYPWLPGILDKPAVGTYRELDYEKVLEVNPQVVIVHATLLELDQIDEEKLATAGITAIGLTFNTQEMFDSEFKILAKMLGEDEKAARFISWKNGYLDLIKEETEGIEPMVRVYGAWSYTPWLTGSEGSGINSMITMAGGSNIAGGLSVLHPTVEPEWVLHENPEVLFFSAFGDYTGYTIDSSENAKQFLEETCNITGLKETDAVHNDRVYVIDGKCVETVRGFIGVHYCAKWFYPERFEDLEPEEIHREYFEEWLNVEYKGTWVYPPVS